MGGAAPNEQSDTAGEDQVRSGEEEQDTILGVLASKRVTSGSRLIPPNVSPSLAPALRVRLLYCTQATISEEEFARASQGQAYWRLYASLASFRMAVRRESEENEGLVDDDGDFVFDWIVSARFDVGWLRPLPPLRSFSRDAVWLSARTWWVLHGSHVAYIVVFHNCGHFRYSSSLE